MSMVGTGERIAKRLSRTGICSRREAEKMISQGRIKIGNTLITSPATLVTDTDIIQFDGKEIGLPVQSRLWRYNKPRGLICTNRDPQGRPTIFDALPRDFPRVILVGRLDISSEGLLLLTNDGTLSRQLELPSTGWVRRYRVRVFGTIDLESLNALKEGISVDGIHYGPIIATPFEGDKKNQHTKNSWLSISLREGKNREVRRVLEYIGLKVNRLIRISYGPFQLGKLPTGKLQEIPSHVLADQFGQSLPKFPKPKSRN
ncbi:MAG: pseudouridine synthase [Rhodospirillaceae bacterium]